MRVYIIEIGSQTESVKGVDVLGHYLDSQNMFYFSIIYIQQGELQFPPTLDN
jgi:hypothetical protein